MNVPRVAAIVTACDRIEQSISTLGRIVACRPEPAEVIVHVDANDVGCEAAIRDAFDSVRILRSDSRIGPGGARNRLISEASSDYVASFDDDSFPMDGDFFGRVRALFERFPEAAVLCATVTHLGEPAAPGEASAEWVADFNGGACVYRHSAFEKTTGYVPLEVAYGMEEADLALRLHAQGERILRTRWLRVFHETDRARHASPEVTAHSIANLALLAYLRYPPSCWHVGVAQCVRRIAWLVGKGRVRGIGRGVRMIPTHLASHRSYRMPVSAAALNSYLALRRGSPAQLTLEGFA